MYTKICNLINLIKTNLDENSQLEIVSNFNYNCIDYNEMKNNFQIDTNGDFFFISINNFNLMYIDLSEIKKINIKIENDIEIEIFDSKTSININILK